MPLTHRVLVCWAGGTATLDWTADCAATGETENLYSANGLATNVGGATATGSVMMAVEYADEGLMGTFGPFALVVPPGAPTAFSFLSDPITVVSTGFDFRIILTITWAGDGVDVLTSAWTEICHPG